MKKRIGLFTCTFLLMTASVFAQTPLKEHKAGHSFFISLPEYMSKAGGLNSAAAIQYKNEVKDVYGFVIFDTKEELRLVEMNYASITEYYEDFIKDFLKDEEKRTVSTPKSQKKGDVNFIECDVTYYDKDVQGEIYYFVGVVETKASFYKVLSWTTVENKLKFKEDFQKLLYSVTDQK